MHRMIKSPCGHDCSVAEERRSESSFKKERQSKMALAITGSIRVVPLPSGLSDRPGRRANILMTRRGSSYFFSAAEIVGDILH